MTRAASRLRQRPLLLAEALAALAVASLLIALTPFRTVARAAAGRNRASQAPASPAEGEAIARAIAAWAGVVPWRTVCFQQGLAAVLMLRRRGRSATLFYGAAHDPETRLVAHVWVRSGAVDVTGCEIARDYSELARFPEA